MMAMQDVILWQIARQIDLRQCLSDALKNEIGIIIIRLHGLFVNKLSFFHGHVCLYKHR